MYRSADGCWDDSSDQYLVHFANGSNGVENSRKNGFVNKRSRVLEARHRRPSCAREPRPKRLPNVRRCRSNPKPTYINARKLLGAASAAVTENPNLQTCPRQPQAAKLKHHHQGALRQRRWYPHRTRRLRASAPTTRSSKWPSTEPKTCREPTISWQLLQLSPPRKQYLRKRKSNCDSSFPKLLLRRARSPFPHSR